MKIGMGQLEGARPDAEASRRTTVAVADRLFDRGADIVILPELAVPGYALDRDAMEAAAEPLDGPTVAAWRGVAAAHDGLLCGGFCEADGDAIFNSVVIVDGDGVKLHYRKLHLFAEEKLVFKPGDRGLPVIDTKFGGLGVCVCYDLRFVETARVLTLSGADLICVPTAWTGGFDPAADSMEVIGQAQGALVQANLTQAFIACCSVGGSSGDIRFLGSSLVADPWGNAVFGPASKTAAVEEVVDIDLGDARAAQVRGPLIEPRSDRRTDVYGVVLDGRTL